MGKKIYQFDDCSLAFFCPGCQEYHIFDGPESKFVWHWNTKFDKPTIFTNIHVKGINDDTGEKFTLCNSRVKDGNIEFTLDSKHHLRGQNVELPDIE